MIVRQELVPYVVGYTGKLDRPGDFQDTIKRHGDFKDFPPETGKFERQVIYNDDKLILTIALLLDNQPNTVNTGLLVASYSGIDECVDIARDYQDKTGIELSDMTENIIPKMCSQLINMATLLYPEFREHGIDYIEKHKEFMRRRKK